MFLGFSFLFWIFPQHFRRTSCFCPWLGHSITVNYFSLRHWWVDMLWIIVTAERSTSGSAFSEFASRNLQTLFDMIQNSSFHQSGLWSNHKPEHFHQPSRLVWGPSFWSAANMSTATEAKLLYVWSDCPELLFQEPTSSYMFEMLLFFFFWTAKAFSRRASHTGQISVLSFWL